MPQDKKHLEQSAHPKGALTVSLIYIVTIIVLWSWVYLTLIERGMTR